MPDDPVADYLRTLNLSDAVRAMAWDAAYAPDDTVAEAQLRKLPKYLNPKVLEDLWNLRQGGTLSGEAKPFAPAKTEDFAPTKPGPTGSVSGRVVRGAAEMLNPVTIAQGLYGAVRHPIDTAGAIIGASVDQGQKAYQAAQEGRVSEAVGHGLGTIPVIGPAAAAVGEGIAETGDIATGVGQGLGMIAPFGAGTAVRGGARVARAVPAAARALEEAAQSRVTQVISPRSTAAIGKRMGARAAEIAPELVVNLTEEGAPLTRGGYHRQIRGQLAAAEAGLDEAADLRLGARTVETQPLIDALLEQRRTLTAEAVEGSQVPRQAAHAPGGGPLPIGENVVPGPNMARVGVIDQAIAELRQLGAFTRYDPLRVIRQAYDGMAKIIYNPSMTADFLRHQGAALGASDVTGTLRRALGRMDPGTAAANQTYSLWRTADEVMTAAAELERVRPKVGRLLMARLAGIMGGSQAGLGGIVTGYLGAPLVDAALASGATTQLKIAQLMQRLATTIRQGNVQQANGLLQTLWRTAKQAAPAGAAVTTNKEK